MASRPQDSTSETENGSNLSEEIKLGEQDVIYPEEIAETYDKILHISDSRHGVQKWENGFEEFEIDYRVAEEELEPRDNYDGGEGVELYDEFDSEDVMVILTGQDGNSLPHFSDLGIQRMEEKGNWWDNPLDYDVDYLMDRWSYEGAVRIPVGAEVGKTEIRGMGDMHYVVDQK